MAREEGGTSVDDRPFYFKFFMGGIYGNWEEVRGVNLDLSFFLVQVHVLHFLLLIYPIYMYFMRMY